MKRFTSNLKDVRYSEPHPRHDTSNALNILVGSDEIAVEAILNQCAKYGKQIFPSL